MIDIVTTLQTRGVGVRSLSNRPIDTITAHGALVFGKAQRMYGARQFTMAEIAASCGVTPMTIYSHIRAGEPATV